MLRSLALLVLAAPLAAAPVAPEPKRVPDVAAFPAAVRAAVGPHFEYLGGEPGRTRTSVGSARAERFWYARIRAKTAGRYVFRYTARLDISPEALAKAPLWGTALAYELPVTVGEGGAVREVYPGLTGGSAYPLVNVGDTLLVPVHTDPYRVEHRFAPVRTAADDPTLGVREGWAGAAFLGPHDPAAVRNAAPADVKLLAGWCRSFGNRPGTETRHGLSAHLEFVRPGAFNLSGRLAVDAATGPGLPVRVVAKDRPVTTVVDSFRFTAHADKVKYGSFASVGHGTLEVRVGDRILIGCGGYNTPGLTPPDRDRTGVVEVLPFHDVPSYEPR
ncbi:MAG TPA: hypothetical protein VD866_21875 [Urbifossiella sp.]|nr:hypothetical protein [Urbifossiella sp.]